MILLASGSVVSRSAKSSGECMCRFRGCVIFDLRLFESGLGSWTSCLHHRPSQKEEDKYRDSAVGKFSPLHFTNVAYTYVSVQQQQIYSEMAKSRPTSRKRRPIVSHSSTRVKEGEERSLRPHGLRMRDRTTRVATNF